VGLEFCATRARGKSLSGGSLPVPRCIENWSFSIGAAHGKARRAMSLLLRELEAFVQEHRRCGELDGGVEGAIPPGASRLNGYP